MRAGQALQMGFHEVFGRLYEQMGLNRLWGARHRMSSRLFRDEVLMRLAHPGRPKRAHAGIMGRTHGEPVRVGKFGRRARHRCSVEG